jgi:Ca2+-binding EF-hand superfamily protein
MIKGQAALVVFAMIAVPPQEKTPTAADNIKTARQLIFLAENRPVFVRLKVTAQGKPFESRWIDSVRALFATLDRNGDGTVTTKEADPKIVAALIRLVTGTPAPPAVPDLDTNPKDGKVSLDELVDAVGPILGPFELQATRLALGRTDALFEYLDRDQDGALVRSELAAIAGSLRPLDLDDDEMTSALEIEMFNTAAFAASGDESFERRPRTATLPPILELAAGESTLRPARLLVRKYDKGKGDAPGRPDGKLSPSEFAIDPEVFAAADANSDGALDSDELRKLLARPPADLTLEVEFSVATSGRGAARVEPGGNLPKSARFRRLADGDVEFAIEKVRLDVHVDDGSAAANDTRRTLEQRFKAADTNKNGYLEAKEQAATNSLQSPLAALWPVIDRDGDGNVYLKEFLEFVDRQLAAARLRLLLSVADQGRSIFGILDLDRDRRLGAREIMRAVDRAMTWDADSDGRVTPDEIPYHFQATITPSGLPGLVGQGMLVPAAGSQAIPINRGDSASGPEWFQKMDRNHDGDVSRREFLGPRDQFDRLDRDSDGLLDAAEANGAGTPKGKG